MDSPYTTLSRAASPSTPPMVCWLVVCVCVLSKSIMYVRTKKRQLQTHKNICLFQGVFYSNITWYLLVTDLLYIISSSLHQWITVMACFLLSPHSCFFLNLSLQTLLSPIFHQYKMVCLEVFLERVYNDSLIISPICMYLKCI